MEILIRDRNAIRIVTAGPQSYNKSHNSSNHHSMKSRNYSQPRRQLPQNDFSHQEPQQKQ